jgi:hypothetical protein
VLNLVKVALLAALGEPQRGLRSRQDMCKEIARAGFHVMEDAGLPEQAARFGVPTPERRDLHASRIILASA